MEVILLGLGCGGRDTMTEAARDALRQADVVIGAKRLLAGLDTAAPCREAVAPARIFDLLRSARCGRAVVVYSGDTGFYSGARGLLPLLDQAGYEVRVLPGISSLQYLAAKLGRPWQDWRLCSAHGVDCDAVYEVMQGRPVFFLTGGEQGAGRICRTLTDAGLGDLRVTLGERLSYPDEQIRTATAAELADREAAALSVLLVQSAPVLPRRTPGLPDSSFVRGAVPMSKRHVRAAILSLLAVEPQDICWDIGAGTGGVSVELALQCRQVWAVERDPAALALTAQNRERLCAWNLHVTAGEAPEALAALPKPDKVFIGGSGGRLRAILEAVHEMAPAAAVCVSAVALETLHAAMAGLTALGYETDVVQLAVSGARAAGSLHLMLSENPVYLITGVRP